MPRQPTLLKKMTPATHDGSLVGTSSAPTSTSEPRGSLTTADRNQSKSFPEHIAALRERARSEIGSAGDDHARRLAAGVRIDDLDFLHA